MEARTLHPDFQNDDLIRAAEEPPQRHMSPIADKCQITPPRREARSGWERPALNSIAIGLSRRMIAVNDARAVLPIKKPREITRLGFTTE